MAQIITMPKLSDTMEEGGISSWLVKEGQSFEEGAPLLAIETDKATVEYASPYSGTLLKILAPEGKACKLQEPIAVFGEKGETFNLDELLKGSGKTPAPAPAPEKKSDDTPKQSSPEPKKEKVPTPTVQEETSSHDPHDQRAKASPLAKKMAKEQGIDLASLAGSGPNGRIVARDVKASPTRSAQAVQSREDRKIPLNMMRKTIAKRLLAAKNEAPHFYLTVSANMEKILRWREDLNAHKDVVSGNAAKVSVNDLLILIVSKALRLHPVVNSSWHDDYILEYGSVNVAFAVALPNGLITPVVFGSDSLGIREIARLTKELGEKAKKGALKTEEYLNGTFTISNLGMTKIEEFTAIINPPQSCILAVGRTQAVPHVDENRQIVIQDRMKMTLSCDHRVVDGMTGAKFLETLVDFLENPLAMLS